MYKTYSHYIIYNHPNFLKIEFLSYNMDFKIKSRYLDLSKIIGVFLLLFILLFFQFNNDYSRYPKIKGHDICIEKLLAGDLYDKEAHCLQGPFFYSFTYI